MEYTGNETYFLRIDKDEDLFETILSWAVEHNVTCAHLSGIGALKDVELGFYHLSEKSYERKLFPKEAELLSLEGNISLLDEKPFLHLHAVLGDENFNAFGGHLFSAKVAVTCEVNIRPIPATAKRIPNEEIGLNLLSFCKIK